MKLTTVVFLVVLVAGCRSGGISEHGFSAEQQTEGSFAVRFEGSETMTEPAIRRNLLHHAARMTLDRGDLYFTLEDYRVTRETHLSKSKAKKAEELPPIVDRNPEIQRGDDAVQQSNAVSLSRPGTATARVKTYRGRPPGVEGLLEASQVIEETSQP